HLEAWINLANGLEQMSRLEAADEALRRALDQAPEHPALKVLAAKLDRRAGRSEAAAERLAGAPPSDAPAAVRQDWLFERGRNLDRIGSLDAAFAAFAEGNAIAAAEGSALLARQGETRRLIASLRECFAPDW